MNSPSVPSARADSVLEKARARAKQAQERLAAAQAAPEPPLLPAAAPSLPLWPEVVRAVPNGFLRSALFGAIGKGRRRFVKGEEIAALEGVQIRYTGERLDQSDLDVYESVLHALRVQAMGEQCRVTSYAMLKLMGITDSGKNRATLQQRIERLRANAVTIKQGRYTYIGGLIDRAYKDEHTQEWVIVLNPELRALYEPDQFTQLEWSVRQSLSGHQLAQWLHGFYASHAQPYPMKVETLHRLCGSETLVMSDFAKKLRKALDVLTEVFKAHGQSFSYEICGDLVHVHKTPSGPQRRRLVSSKKPAA